MCLFPLGLLFSLTGNHPQSAPACSFLRFAMTTVQSSNGLTLNKQKNQKLNSYIDKHIATVRRQISADINDKTVDNVVRTFLAFHLSDKNSSSFQDYYFLTLTNNDYFLNSPTFFRDFKKHYSLQGIDNGYLDTLESDKQNILSLLQADNLADLYFNYFAKANIKHGTKTVDKDLGSFFAKLVHTFKPADYCALDNPIKNYFGLQRESFFIAFSIISSAYKLWAADNEIILEYIKQQFENIDNKHLIRHDRVTNLKLLDLVYWSKANIN